MAQLADERCVACRPDSPHVTDKELETLLPLVPQWKVITEGGVQKLQRAYKFDDFRGALAFTNKVGNLAEEEDHHPRILLTWGRMTVTWWTHAIKDLHRNDLIMASKCDMAFEGKAVSRA